ACEDCAVRATAFSASIPTAKDLFRARVPYIISPRCRRLIAISDVRSKRQYCTTNPGVVLTSRDVFEQCPAFRVAGAFSRTQLNLRAKALKFEKIGIGEYLKIASEIGIQCAGCYRSGLNKYRAIKKISAPTCRVVDTSHLLRKTTCGIHLLLQLNIFRPQNPSRIRKIGK